MLCSCLFVCVCEFIYLPSGAEVVYVRFNVAGPRGLNFKRKGDPREQCAVQSCQPAAESQEHGRDLLERSRVIPPRALSLYVVLFYNQSILLLYSYTIEPLLGSLSSHHANEIVKVEGSTYRKSIEGLNG